MDAERVRAYLQAACAGLGFDVGEVWLTSSPNGSSSVAAIQSPHGAPSRSGNVQRFVQLYTSKSFESHRSELINPPDSSWDAAINDTEEQEEHVLSPRLVDAISATAQVVWATTKKQEGLTGRSDVILQTAVGMPVAMDSNGNMCVVVMFSPNNIPSTDDSLDFLRSLSQSAATTSIPCLLPAFDPIKTGMREIGPGAANHQAVVAYGRNSGQGILGDGVYTRFVSISDIDNRIGATSISDMDGQGQPDLHSAPKDNFGIPMLPSYAEIGSFIPEASLDVFDEASYGVWTTVMDKSEGLGNDVEYAQVFDINSDDNDGKDGSSQPAVLSGNDASLLQTARVQRLEEFCHAFLGMSVFDLAEVWVPDSNYADSLRLCMSATCTETNEILNEFRKCSANKTIKQWSGAVGRAFASGSPVWTANPKVFVDPTRADAFSFAKIQTVLAVPVFAGTKSIPTCVVVCYSLVKSGSVPFVLRFVQQALRLLWDGLDTVKPRESVQRNIWQEVAPADLGEMAADVEMQHHFMSKKRPYASVSEPVTRGSDQPAMSLASQMRTFAFSESDFNPIPVITGASTPASVTPPTSQGHDPIIFSSVRNHVSDAIRSIGTAVPIDHVATNPEGTKRAHISVRRPAPLAQPNRLPNRVISAAESMSSRNQSLPLFEGVQNGQTFDLSIPDPSPIFHIGMSTVESNDFTAPIVVSNLSVASVQQQQQQQTMPINATNQFCLPIGATQPRVKLCRIQGCSDPAVARRPHCTKHSGTRLCERPGCSKCAQGSTRFCIAHGGGRRCTYPGCDKGARDKFFCAAHGGGKRCMKEGCTKSAVGGSKLCTAHGGGRRCSVEGCDKSAQSSTNFCVKHGGGKKCAHESCEKVARGRTRYCAAHGGGVRCKLEGCNRVAIGKRQLCRMHGGGASRKNGNGAGASQAHQTALQGVMPQTQAAAQVASFQAQGSNPGNTFQVQGVPYEFLTSTSI